MALVAVLDSNVMFPFTLRDTLLRAAAAGLHPAHWSEQILTEARRNLILSARITEDQADRLLAAMAKAFPDAIVGGYEPLIPAMRNHAGDRHVAAAAVKAKARVIVTLNARHFRSLPSGIEAWSPDEFLQCLLALGPDTMLALLRAQSTALRSPPRTLDEVLAGLARFVPGFAARVSARLKRS